MIVCLHGQKIAFGKRVPVVYLQHALVNVPLVLKAKGFGGISVVTVLASQILHFQGKQPNTRIWLSL